MTATQDEALSSQVSHSFLQIRPDPGPGYRTSSAYESYPYPHRIHSAGVYPILVDDSAGSPANRNGLVSDTAQVRSR